MSKLWDYTCKKCGKTTEFFECDDEKECPNCGKKKFTQTLAALNINTRRKSTPNRSMENGQFGGIAFEVKETGELGKQQLLAHGEILEIPDGNKMIISGQPFPDMEVIKKFAQKLLASDKPPKEDMH